MNSVRVSSAAASAWIILCLGVSGFSLSARAAASVRIETSFFDTPDRLGFFQVSARFTDQPPPEREVIFVFAPSGDEKIDAAGPILLKHFAESLNPGDSFNVLYQSKTRGF